MGSPARWSKTWSRRRFISICCRRWDVWYLVNKLNAHVDGAIVGRKFADYGTSDVEAKAKQRCDELAKASTAKLFRGEMRRFLPAKRVAEMDGTGLHHTILAASSE